MITFKSFLAEMATPTAAHRAKTYYHGTSSEVAAQGILKSGIEPGDIIFPERFKPKKGANLVPIAGKVYVTPDIRYAQMYAIGGDMAGYDWKPHAKNGNEPGDHGYVFAISGQDLQDIQPDEDSVGELIYHAANDMKNADPVLRRLALLAQDKLTVNQWRKFLDAEYVMWAHAGKKLLPLLSDEQKLHLIDLGAHVAHTGKLMPNAAYRIAFANIKNLKRDGSNFFEYAEKIK